ncbi:MAG: carboxypeptidase M32, partial [Yoonia sp.]
MNAYDDLMQFQRETEALAQVAGRLGWDQETMMPDGAGPQRAEEHGAMANILHARRIDPRVGDWLAEAEAEAEAVDDVAAANLRHIRRSFERTTKVPARLAAELARATSLAHRVWAKARAEEDVATFLPVLQKVLDLRREEAAAIAGGTDPYDALLDDYEPGATGARLSAMFAALRPRLVDLRAAVLDAPAPPALQGTFDEAGQLALSQKLALAFGYNLDNGRIDKAVHPFSSGSGLDVRITTRTNPVDPFNCFYSTIHEVGHAAYEQGIDTAHLLTPVGAGVSMGVHESQSRIYENQLGRSRAFTGWLYGQMRDQFGEFGI